MSTIPLQFSNTPRGRIAFRKTTTEESDRSFDVAFWQAQKPEARFQAAWEMVCLGWEIKGRPMNELRLQRTVGRIERA